MKSADTATQLSARDLWAAVRARVDETTPLERRGIPGFVYQGSVKSVAMDLWPARLATRVAANSETMVLYRELRGSYNAVCLDHSSQPPIWWIRDEWNEPKMTITAPPKPSPALFQPPQTPQYLPPTGPATNTANSVVPTKSKSKTGITINTVIDAVINADSAVTSRDVIQTLGFDPDDHQVVAQVCRFLARATEQGALYRQKRKRPGRDGERRMYVYTPTTRIASSKEKSTTTRNASDATRTKILEVISQSPNPVTSKDIGRVIYGTDVASNLLSGRIGHILLALVETGQVVRVKKAVEGARSMYVYSVPGGTPVPSVTPSSPPPPPLSPALTTPSDTVLSDDVDTAIEFLREALTAQVRSVIQERDSLREQLAAIRKAIG